MGTYESSHNKLNYAEAVKTSADKLPIEKSLEKNLAIIIRLQPTPSNPGEITRQVFPSLPINTDNPYLK